MPIKSALTLRISLFNQRQFRVMEDTRWTVSSVHLSWPVCHAEPRLAQAPAGRKYLWLSAPECPVNVLAGNPTVISSAPQHWLLLHTINQPAL